MMSIRKAPMALILTITVWTVLTVTLLAGIAQAQEDAQALTPGIAAPGELESRQGDLWTLRLCQGDTLTVTMQSNEFVPFLELLDPAEELLDDALAEEDTATIADVAIEETGNYLIVAAGESRTDRGAYTLTVALEEAILDEPIDGTLAPGAVTTSTLRPRRVAAWAFHACAGDVISATVDSADFDAFVELFRAGEEELLADDENSDGNDEVALTGVTLEESGQYVLLVSGVGRLDAGDYTVTLDVAVADEAPGDATTTPTRAAGIPRQTATPTRTPTPSSPVCTVVAAALNVRSGPGTIFAPPIGSLRDGDVVDMLARDRLSTWIEIQEPRSRLRGWVSNSPQFVDCTVAVSTLPLGDIPPTPTPTATATPSPTPTPTPTERVAQAPRPPTEIGIGGGGGGGLAGEIRADTALVRDPNGQPTFRDAMYLRMLVWNPDRGNDDGDGIDYVEFFIEENFGDFREVHYRRENTAGYCSFGGGEPLCNELRLRSGARWPETDIPIFNGDYTATIVAHPRDSSDTPSWSVGFTIASPNLESDDGNGYGQPEALVASIAQTGPDTQSNTVRDALVFQVIAYDPGRGDDDGDGIDNVRHEIFGPDGDRVYERQESNAHYCAFSGGEPDCDVFRFTVGESYWEGTNNRVEAGPHLLRATVRADDDRTVVVEQVITIE